MPHRAVPRAVKRERARVGEPSSSFRSPAESPKVSALTKSTAVVIRAEKRFNNRKNWAPTMGDAELAEVRTVLQTRFHAAEAVTDEVAGKMNNWEKQFQGEWQDSSHIDDEHIFLNKTREQVQTVGAFLHGMVLQVPRLVEFHPAPSSMVGFDEMWRRAKLKEGLQSYYFDDIWRIRHTVIPDYIRTFLKFTTGIIKTSYREDRNKPDLCFEVKDRALQYIDPYARRMRDASWWFDREFWSRSAVEEMFQMGHWHRPHGFPDVAPSSVISQANDGALRRLYGDNFDAQVPVPEDELVTVDHYYQAPTNLRGGLYGVTLGGENGWLVRYGPTPWAYDGIPFRGGSYDPHEWRIDGTGAVAMHTALQEIINTALNLRMDDWRNNLWDPKLIPEKLVTDKTMEDWNKRSKLVRVSNEVWELLQGSPGAKIGNMIGDLGINSRESLQLYQDLSFLLGQSKEIGHTGDIFRGQSPSKVTTAAEVQEVLSANQSTFRPAFMSIMHTIEEMAEISQAYFSDPDFFGTERILIATGGRYRDVVKDWHHESSDVRARSVSFDEMDVEVNITAMNAADAMLARTFKSGMIRDLLGAIGAVEGLFDEMRDRVDFVPLVMDFMRSVTTDVDAYERSPQEAAEKKQEREQKQQKGIAMQAKMEQVKAQAKEGARAQREVAVAKAESQLDQAAAQNDAALETRKELALLGPTTRNDIEKIVAQVNAEHQATIQEMLLKFTQTVKQMVLEQRLEVEAAKELGKTNATVSVGTGGNQVNQ